MSDAYGFLATIYQPLSGLVFGKDLIAANSVFSALAQGKRSLIIGGGDGFAYRDWDESFGGEYWDSSAKMADLAKASLAKSRLAVNCGRWSGQGRFDVVFLPFVLDTFQDQEIEKILFQIRNCLKRDGKVVLSDFFSPQTLAQKTLQQAMLLGFRVLAGHPRSDLPDLAAFFDPTIWKLSEEKTWKKGWIRARVYGLVQCQAK